MMLMQMTQCSAAYHFNVRVLGGHNFANAAEQGEAIEDNAVARLCADHTFKNVGKSE
jgi:hypothetical protein